MMEIFEKIEGTPEQQEACRELKQKMVAFIGANQTAGLCLMIDPVKQFTVSVFGFAVDGTIFTNNPGKLEMDPSMTRAFEVFRRDPDIITTSEGMKQFVGMAVKTAMTKQILTELRQALVSQLDGVLEAEKAADEMMRSFPEFIQNEIRVALS